MEQINIDKMDDIQLAMYLAQKNNQGYGILYIERQANEFYKWMKSKRDEISDKTKQEHVTTN